MSSPISSLKKGKKLSPFGTTQRTVPFRTGNYTVDESSLLDDITTTMNSGRRSSQVGVLPKLDHASPSPAPGKAGTPSDHELMSIMMARLSQLEQRIQTQTREILEKDKQIRILKEKMSILQKGRDRESPGRCAELEKQCLLLQQQVHEMETFLDDYGMMWVGEKSDPASAVYVADDNQKGSRDSDEEDTVWNPASSLAASKAAPDFSQIIQNVQELNVLAGEGVAKIQHTTGGAKLKIPDAVPLTLYANGMLMFSGPFRSYDEPTTKECIRDLQDGYFPAELQHRYPDGVPINVKDMRHTYFKDTRPSLAFQGTGQLLGGETRPSRLVPSNLANIPAGCNETSEIPGPKLSMDQFLKKLPSSVVKQGKIIDIRDSIGDALHGSEGSGSLTVVDTAALDEMKARMEKDESQRPPSSRNITTLRVKSENGDHTYILKMKFNETVGDLRRYIDAQRPRNSPDYQIVSTFPKMAYEDPSATLHACGLIPNAALHLKARGR